MAQISLNIEEYNAMVKSLEQANAEIAQTRQEIEKMKQIVELCKDTCNEFVQSGLFERIFKWNRILNKHDSSMKIIEKNIKT